MSKNTKIIIGAVIIILIGFGIYFAAQRTRQQPQTQTVSSGEQIISSGDIYSAQSNDILKNGNLYASSNTQVQQIIPSPNGTSFIIKLTPGQDSPIGSFAKLEDGKINLLDSGEIFDAAWLDNSRIIYSARKDSSTDIKIKSASGDKKILSVANEDVNLFPADNSLFISYPKDDDTAVVEKVDLANKSAAPVPSGGEALFSVSPD